MGELCEIGYEEPAAMFGRGCASGVSYPIPHGFTPAMDHQAHIDPPVLEPYLHVQIAPTVPDAQSAPNAVFVDGCQTHVSVADPSYKIPLTQNYPSKCLNRMVFGSLPHSLHLFLSFFPHFSTYVAGDIPENVDVPPVAAQVHFGDRFRGSNSVKIMHDSGPYEMARALDSCDDRPVGELTESDVEMLRRIFPSRVIQDFTSSVILLFSIRRVHKDVMMSS